MNSDEDNNIAPNPVASNLVNQQKQRAMCIVRDGFATPYSGQMGIVVLLNVLL